MLKRSTAFLLAILMMFTLCCCTSGGSDGADIEKSEDEDEEEKNDISKYLDIGYHLELRGLSQSQYFYLKNYKGPNGVFDEQKQLYVIVEETVTENGLGTGKDKYDICIRFGKEKNLADPELVCKYYSDFIFNYYLTIVNLEDDTVVITHEKTELLVYTLTESKTAVYNDVLLYGTETGLMINTHIIINSLTKDQYDTLAGTSDSPLASIFNTKKYKVHYDGTNSDGTYYVHISLGESTSISEVYNEYIDFMYHTLHQLEVPTENIFLTENFRSGALAAE